MPTDTPKTAKDLIGILNKEIEAGAKRAKRGGFSIERPGLAVLKKYSLSFERRLKMGLWAEEGAAVRNAARQVGVIAAAIASLERKDKITAAMIEEATTLVEAHCSIGNLQGRWCKAQ